MHYRRICWGICLFLIMPLISCAHKPLSFKPGTAIAVWDLDDVSPSQGAGISLGEHLSARIIETIKERGIYPIVERDRLLLALEELHLGTTSLVDEGTRLRLGRIAGAQLMVFGGYQIIGDTMRMDLRLVDVETGRVLKAVKRITPSTDMPGWLNAASEASAELFQ